MAEHGDHIHRWVWDLLPWSVNGTLEPEERRRVEEHVAGCPLCREEVARSRRLAEMVRAAGEVAPAPHPAELQRLLARLGEEGDELEAADPASSVDSADSRDPAPVRRASGKAWLRWLAVAQAAALVALLALLLAQRAPAPPALFRTLSAPEPAVGMAGAVRIRLLFSPETPERELRALLAGIEGQLAGGPSPLGVYTVAVPAGPAADPLPVVLSYLRSHPAVRFAEPAADSPAGAAR